MRPAGVVVHRAAPPELLEQGLQQRWGCMQGIEVNVGIWRASAMLLLLLAPGSRAALMHGPSFGTAHKGCWTPPSCGGPGATGCACKPFPQAVEVPVFNHTCNQEDGTSTTICLMQHLWTGGSDTPFQLYGSYRVRYYVDGETTASVNIPVGMGTGEPYMDDSGPWSAGSAFGKTGNPSGTFNNFPVPFNRSINVTVETFQGGKPGAPVSLAAHDVHLGQAHSHACLYMNSSPM